MRLPPSHATPYLSIAMRSLGDGHCNILGVSGGQRLLADTTPTLLGQSGGGGRWGSVTAAATGYAGRGEPAGF